MAPLPPIVDAAWKAYVAGMKTTPRYGEFNGSSTTKTIRGTPVTFKTLGLDPKSATYAQISNSQGSGNTSTRSPNPDLVSLKYTVETIGSAPDDGYPLFLAMHGGGATTTDDNDGQWLNMIGFYRSAISQGIYIALRGVGDTWDLHFTSAGYVLIERLIENFILFGNVNPNKVYILGFSAGGDGVFRIAPRLAQRFCAANVGGGHPGSVQFDGIINLPMCLQVGEYDNYVGRSKALVGSGIAIDNLKSKYASEPAAYQKDVFIHRALNDATFDLSNPQSNYVARHWDWESYYAAMSSTEYPSRGWVKIVNDYQNWYANYPNAIPGPYHYADTHAINWMVSHSGNRSRPQRVVWDLREGENFTSACFSDIAGRGATGIGRSQNYWLDIARYTRATVGDIIEASIDRAANTINVVRGQNYLRILLTPDMLAQPNKPVIVNVANQNLNVTVKWDNMIVVAETMVRNDPSFIFTGDIVLTQRQDGDRSWSAQSGVVAAKL